VRRYKNLNLIALTGLIGLSFISGPAFAADADVSQVQNFIKSVIGVITGIAALVAALIFVIGGIMYIFSAGNPERLDRAKSTLLYSAIGLAICIGAYAITNIVAGLATSAFGK
jgi:cbb3-type cytochrome oxidase subunit 3